MTTATAPGARATTGSSAAEPGWLRGPAEVGRRDDRAPRGEGRAGQRDRRQGRARDGAVGHHKFGWVTTEHLAKLLEPCSRDEPGAGLAPRARGGGGGAGGLGG